MPTPAIRSLFRRLLPSRLRAPLRRWVAATPQLLRDLPADLADLLPRTGRLPLPPPWLRARVSLTPSRAEYLEVGARLGCDLLAAAARAGAIENHSARWLDFGCGSGRIARAIMTANLSEEFIGVDIDRSAVAWCRRNLPGRFFAIEPDASLPLPPSSIDLVYAVSVFSHFPENTQDFWLEEMRRILRPGGILIASTHAPSLTVTRPDLTQDDLAALEHRGFLFAPGTGTFNSDGAFHSRSYLLEHWGSIFDPVEIVDRGLGGYQDLSVWRRRSQA